MSKQNDNEAQPLHAVKPDSDLTAIESVISGANGYPRQRCVQYRAFRQSDNPRFLETLGPQSLIARGAGQSYGDAALNQSRSVVLQDRLDRLIDFDPDAGEVTCEAGVSLKHLIHVFLPRGYFPLVTPGTSFVTIGGAIAADVHGKNHHRDGSFESSLIWFDLLLADVSTVRCSRRENPDLYYATVGGMGLTGIITRARLRLRRVHTAAVRVDYVQAPDLDALLRAMARDDAYRYSVAWIDCLAKGASLGRGVVMLGDHAQRDDLPVAHRDKALTPRKTREWRIPCHAPTWLLNRHNVGAFNHWYYHRHATGQRIEGYRRFFYPLDAVTGWQRLYGKQGFVQYQTIIPTDAGTRPVIQILQRLANFGRPSFLAVLKRFGQPSGGLLSFPRPGLTLALDLPRPDQALRQLIRELDRITLDHGGRIYLAKDACLDPDDLPPMYDQLDHFRALKKRVDPTGVFDSSQARRLKISAPA